MGKQDQRMILILTCKCHRLNLLKAAEVPEKIFVLPIKWPYYQKFYPCPAALQFSRTRCSSSGLSSQTASAGQASHWTWADGCCWSKAALSLTWRCRGSPSAWRRTHWTGTGSPSWCALRSHHSQWTSTYQCLLRLRSKSCRFQTSWSN